MLRSFLLIASAIVAFGATMTFESTDANAVVCARGVYRAGERYQALDIVSKNGGSFIARRTIRANVPATAGLI